MHCCKDCKWYFCDKEFHSCFGHYLIVSPLILVESVEDINECPVFEERIQYITRDEIETEWLSTYTYANDDKYNAAVESMCNDIVNGLMVKNYE